MTTINNVEKVFQQVENDKKQSSGQLMQVLVLKLTFQQTKKSRKKGKGFRPHPVFLITANSKKILTRI